MATTETRSASEAAAPIADAATGIDHEVADEASNLESLFGTGDHKRIGRTLITVGLLGVIAGLVLEVVALAVGGNLVELSGDTDYLPQIWSIGRDLLTFGGVAPILVGLGVYLVPLQIGAPSLAFSRGAAAASWTWLLGLALLVLAYISNGGPGGTRTDFVVLWAAALAMMIGGLLWALVCIAATILGARTQGMSLDRTPATTWSFLMFAVLGLIQLPITMGELLLAYLRTRYGLLPLEQSAELHGVLDGWLVGPSVYWFAVPVLGFAVDAIATHTDVPVRRHGAVLAAITLFSLNSFGYAFGGLSTVRNSNDLGMAVPLLLLAPLTVLAVLALAGDSLRRGTFAPRAGLVGGLLSGLLLLAGSAVALLAVVKPIMAALDEAAPDAIDMTNTLIVVGTRFEEGVALVVLGAVLVGIVGALQHWSIKLFGPRLAEPLGLLAILAIAGGAVLVGLGEILAGVADEPALPAYATDDVAAILPLISVIGAGLLAGGALLVGANMVLSLVTTKPAGTQSVPWSGTTLEWATASPPVTGNFPAPPIVTSAAPLADGELQYVGLNQAEED
jgi:heme/copper-type cytochrome/quinol oxidase subunit 1